MSRPYDLVLFGATGFTGNLVAEHLARAPERIRWALAGRDAVKLARVRDELGSRPDVLLADVDDPAALKYLARRTRVLCSTVGPYAKYGSGVVEACARHGTDYCDITGEAFWIGRMIELHHRTAEQTGARIVHACGFDSVPSDLGNLVVQAYAAEHFGRPCDRISAWFGETRGSFSGGGFATLMHSLDVYEREPALRARVEDVGVRWDSRIESWTGPFVMAAVNTGVVRRSHALLGHPWGERFDYREARSFDGRALGLLRATGATLALAGLFGATGVRPLRRLITRHLPEPGTGPSAEERAKGHYVVRFVGEIDGEPRVACRFSDRRDPGCNATTSMLAQAALALACDDLPRRGGILTPATALGMSLAARLRREGTVIDVGEFRRLAA